MDARIFNVFVIIFILFAAIPLMFRGCASRSVEYQYPTQQAYNTTTATNTTITGEGAEGLDLEAVGALLKEAETGEEFEKLLNKPGGVNNLDLDADGEVDYIRVTEFGEGDVRGFTLSTELEEGEEQEIATIKIEKDTEQEAVVQMHGNPQLYGANHYYHNRFGIGDALLLGWVFSNVHSPWNSPYRYGNYPSNYNRYSTVDRSTYRNRTSPFRNNTSLSRASAPVVSQQARSVSSPVAGKTSDKVKAPLRNPTQSQRAFQQRSARQSTPRATGFGRSNTSRATSSSSRPTTRSPSVRSSSSSRSRSFSSGGK